MYLCDIVKNKNRIMEVFFWIVIAFCLVITIYCIDWTLNKDADIGGRLLTAIGSIIFTLFVGVIVFSPSIDNYETINETDTTVTYRYTNLIHTVYRDTTVHKDIDLKGTVIDIDYTGGRDNSRYMKVLLENGQILIFELYNRESPRKYVKIHKTYYPDLNYYYNGRHTMD